MPYLLLSVILGLLGSLATLQAEPQKIQPKPTTAPVTVKVPPTDSPRTKKPLVFLAQVDHSPWIIEDEKDVIKDGILHDMAVTLGGLAGFSVEVQSAPFARFEKLIGEQTFDFAFVSKQQATSKGILFPETIMETQVGLVHLNKNPQFADCSKMKAIAHTNESSSFMSELIVKKCGNVQIINTNSLEQRIKMLKHERVDGYLGSSQDVDLARWFDLPCNAMTFTKFFDISFHVLVSEQSPLASPEHRPIIEKFIKSYRTEYFEKIRKKVLGERFCPITSQKLR